MSDEILDRLRNWCDAEQGMSLDGSSVIVDGDPPLHLDVTTGEDAVVLAVTEVIVGPATDFAEKARKLLSRRGSMVTGDVATGPDATTVDLRYPIYTEGLNRQSFVVAVRTLAGTVDELRDLATAGAAAAPAVEASPSPPPSEPHSEPAARPAARPAAQPAPWSATHRVPATGMAAWNEPDPTATPAANLGANVELRVDEVRGAWASVTASNGWTGWVDARLLVQAGSVPVSRPAPRGPRTTAGGLPIHIPALIGGVMMVVGNFLDWIIGKGLDWPVSSAWPLYEFISWSQPRIGLVVLIAAAIVIVAGLTPQVPSAAQVMAALVAAAFTALLAVSIIINLDLDLLIDLKAIGIWVTLVGGLVAAIPRGVNR